MSDPENTSTSSGSACREKSPATYATSLGGKTQAHPGVAVCVAYGNLLLFWLRCLESTRCDAAGVPQQTQWFV